ncbi:hypothetical protein, partial [Streptomyces pseudogriseolus]|uniref:hypothetical protein n=1 Tax=Streptomyces pseudogriseolus TaxID=36817 RepID=UPI00347DAB4A
MQIPVLFGGRHDPYQRRGPASGSVRRHRRPQPGRRPGPAGVVDAHRRGRGGSQGNEWRRLADTAVSEVARWVSGEGFLH